MFFGAEKLIGTKVFVGLGGGEVISEIIAVNSFDEEVKVFVVLKKGDRAGSVVCAGFECLRFPMPDQKKLKLIAVNQETKICTIKTLREHLGYGLQYAVGLVNSHLPAMLGEDLDEDKLQELAEKLRSQGCEVEFV
jgi:ribosomal protein L7/L12